MGAGWGPSLPQGTVDVLSPATPWPFCPEGLTKALAYRAAEPLGGCKGQALADRARSNPTAAWHGRKGSARPKRTK